MRAARQLLFLGEVESLAVFEPKAGRLNAVIASLGHPARAASGVLDAVEDAQVVILAGPRGHREAAEAALDAGASVVSVSDDVDDVRALLELDAEAADLGCHVVVGAGFSPGLSCLLAAHAARGFENVDEVHVAKVGTGGPACAHQHHVALRGSALHYAQGAWERRRGQSGRSLIWFPDPVCGVDCYYASLPEPLLLEAAFPQADRLTARVGANRRDRLTAHLPMLRRPHPEGALGAVRVEVRGRQGQVRGDRVFGAIDRPAVAAGTVAALAARWAVDGRLPRAGAAGLATLTDPGPFLAALADRGIKAAIFEGSGASANQA